MNAIRAVFALLMLAVALPAKAGIVATYRADASAMSLIFEVADNGDFRSAMPGQPRYLLGIGGTTYSVENGAAARVSDYGIVMREIRPERAQGEKLTFGIVQSGTAEEHGRRGRAYYPDFGDGPYRERLVWVISDDPALKPLGSAFVRHFDAGWQMGESMIPVDGDSMQAFVAPMRTGTPLVAFIHLRLVSLEFRAIAPDRLALPGRIETLEQLRARLHS